MKIFQDDKCISYVFQSSSLENLDLSSFDTSIISHCISLKNINISIFNTSEVTNIWGMFYNSSSLDYIDLSTFNTSKVDNMIVFLQIVLHWKV